MREGMLRLSLRSVPILMSLGVMIATAAICLGITTSTQQSTVDLLRSGAREDVNVMFVTASMNTQRLSNKWMASVLTCAETFVVGILNSTREMVTKYQAHVTATLRRSPRDPYGDGLSDTMMNDYYHELSHSRVQALLYITIRRRHDMMLQAPWALTIDDISQKDYLYIQTNGSTYGSLGMDVKALGPGYSSSDLAMTVCPMTPDVTCNNSFYRSSTSLLTNGSTYTQVFHNYPSYMSGLDLSPFIPWVAINTNNKVRGDVVWTPLREYDYYLACTLFGAVRSPYVPKHPILGDVIGVVGAGVDLRVLSKYLASITKLPGQRIFITVTDDSLMIDSPNLGNLVAVSHGNSMTLSVRSTYSGGVTAGAGRVPAVDSDDEIIRGAARWVERQPRKYRDLVDSTTADGAGMSFYLTSNDNNSNSSTSLYGDRYIIMGSNVSTIEGIGWTVVVVVPWNYVMGDVEVNNARAAQNLADHDAQVSSMVVVSQIVLYSVLAVLCVLMMLGVYIITVGYTTPLLELRADMENVASMKLDLIDMSKPLSVIHEVESMQLHFQKMVSNLEEYRAFMPQAIFEEDAPSTVSKEGSPGNSLMVPIVEDTRDTGMFVAPSVATNMSIGTINDPRGTPRGSPKCDVFSPNGVFSNSMRRFSGRSRGSMSSQSTFTMDANASPPGSPRELNRSSRRRSITFRDDARVQRLREMGFRLYSATFMSASLNDDNVGPEFGPERTFQMRQAFVGAFLRVMEKNGEGIHFTIQGDKVVGSWNAFRPCVNHEISACDASFMLRQEVGKTTSIRLVITSSQVIVGFVGTHKSKSPTILGPAITEIDPMLSLAGPVQAKVLASENVARKLHGKYCAAAVDVIRFGLDRPAQRVFEVIPIPTGKDVKAVEDAMTAYHLSFSRFTARNYSEALSCLTTFMRDHSSVLDDGLVHQCLRLSQLSLAFDDDHQRVNRFPRGCPGWQDWPSNQIIRELPDELVQLFLAHANYLVSPNSLQQPSPTLVQNIDLKQRAKDVRELLRSQQSELERMSSNSSVDPDDRGMLEFSATNGSKYYRSDKMLGRGATSCVYLGMSEVGSLVALKCVHIPDDPTTPDTTQRRRRQKRDELEEVLREVNLMSELRHDNIVAYLGTAVVGNELLILTEYVSGGSLANTLESFGKIPLRSVKRYLADILHGLEYLHSHGIIHRDIKPHNVLLMIDGQCKLMDFGASAKLNSTEANGNVAGTPLYMAPEACLGQATKLSDIWAIGILTIELLTGKVPWTDTQRLGSGTSFVAPQFVYRVGHDDTMVPTIPTHGLPSAAIDFAQRCLQRDAELRPTVASLLAHELLL